MSVALRLGLAHGLLMAEAGALRANPLRRRPRGMAPSAEVDERIDKAGFLGRWFSEQPDPVTIGLIPQSRWRSNSSSRHTAPLACRQSAPHRAGQGGETFENGVLVERPDEFNKQ